jgi:serine/threonine protein kinase/tetratricopeptide (TPR) repeat protein
MPATINGYQLAGTIGTGGQSRVFSLVDHEPGRPLALKWSHERFTPAWSDPLVEEYRTLCSLTHPQLVQPRDFGYAEGRAYMVIDRVAGPTLFDGLPGPGVASLWTLLQAVSPVLSFLHRRGVIHRDLKPDNFRWGTAGVDPRAETDTARLYLLDLGLASRPHDPAGEGKAGTLFYMAPEVLKEGKLDARSDLYSLGIILYQWLCGTPPFPGPGPAEIIDGHLTGTIHWPQAVADGIERKILLQIEALLAKDPDKRPADIETAISGFVEAGMPVDGSVLVTANLPWHQRSTAAEFPDIAYPKETVPHPRPPVSILLSGDPGAGISAVLTRWQRELKVHGWSIETTTTSFTAKVPEEIQPTISVTSSVGPGEIASADEANQRSCHLALRPLDNHTVAKYLQRVIFDQECVETILPAALRLSSGLPGALDLLLTAWLESGTVRHQHGRWIIDVGRLDEPVINRPLRELYGRGLGELTAAQLRCLGFAAIFGTHFSTTLLRGVLTEAGIPPETIDDLAARGVFIPASDPAEPLVDCRFRLCGLAEIWAADLPPGHCQSLHRPLAAALHHAGREWGPRVHRRLTHHHLAAGQPREAYAAAIAWAEKNMTAEGAEEARRYLDLAETAVSDFEPDPTRSDSAARIALLRGRSCKASGLHENAQSCFRRVFAVARKTGNIRLHAEAAKHLGDSYKATRQHLKGARILKIALKNFTQLGDEIEISHTLNNLGNIAYYRQDLDPALEYYLKALAIQRRHDLTAVMASTLSNIGSVYVQKCDFEQGQRYMQESLRLKETLDQPGEVARTMNNLGSVNTIIGEYAAAEDYLHRAAAINESIGAGDEWLINWINIFEAWYLQAEYRRAIDKAPQIFRRCDELDDVTYRTFIHVHLARCLFRTGDYRASQYHLEQAGTRMEQITDSSLMARYFTLQAEIHLVFRDIERCRRSLSAALAHADKTADPRERAEVFLAAAHAEQVLGEISPEFFAPAAEAHRLFEHNAGRHRLFELLLITSNAALAEFLAEFPLPGSIGELSADRYTGPAGQRGLWLWRLAQKARDEGQTGAAERLLTSLVQWSTKHETAELTWRAHAELGILYHAANDYELATNSFVTAFGELQKIAATITSDKDKKSYLAGEDITRLSSQMKAFSARFAAKK